MARRDTGSRPRSRQVELPPIHSTVIREGKSLRLQGTSPGDPLRDALAGAAAVSIAFRVENTGQTIDHCVTNTACRRRAMSDGGFQLDCRDGVADPTCVALPPVCGNGVREITVTSTQALWSVRNICTGAQLGTVHGGALCSSGGGTCEPA